MEGCRGVGWGGCHMPQRYASSARRLCAVLRRCVAAVLFRLRVCLRHFGLPPMAVQVEPAGQAGLHVAMVGLGTAGRGRGTGSTRARQACADGVGLRGRGQAGGRQAGKQVAGRRAGIGAPPASHRDEILLLAVSVVHFWPEGHLREKHGSTRHTPRTHRWPVLQGCPELQGAPTPRARAGPAPEVVPGLPPSADRIPDVGGCCCCCAGGGTVELVVLAGGEGAVELAGGGVVVVVAAGGGVAPPLMGTQSLHLHQWRHKVGGGAHQQAAPPEEPPARCPGAGLRRFPMCPAYCTSCPGSK